MEFIPIQWRGERYTDEIALRDRLLRKPLGLSFSQDQLDEEVSQLHFGIIEADALIACVVIVPLSVRHAKLRQMAVDEVWQRQGVGSRLVTGVEAVLADRGFVSIELNAREPVVGFYESLGYKSDGDRFVEVTIPHQKMVKQLADAS